MIETLSIVLTVAGGLGIFLLGMKHLSEGLQALSGNGLRKFMAMATTHRIAGVLTGMTSTVIVQSSSIITVMAVGFVSTGLMSLQQSINVIIGSNIGTTATAWLIAYIPAVGQVGLTIIAFAMILYFFVSNEKVHNIGLALMGFGLIFFGLDLMKTGMEPVKELDSIRQCFASLDASSVGGLVRCVLVSTLFTAIIQSSAATTAIAMTLAQQGLITFEAAAATVFGMNIGTTITAWLAALGATTEARRAALAHTLFNIIGTVIMLPFFLPVLIPVMRDIFPNISVSATLKDGTLWYPHVAAPMAYIHTAFNVLNTLLFLPFITPFARLVTFLVPAKRKEIPRLTYLNPHVKHTPVIAIDQAFREVAFMADSDIDLFNALRKVVAGDTTDELEEHIFHRENILDSMQREITDFLGHVMTGRLPTDVATRARMLLRVTDEFESVSDESAGILKMIRRMRTNSLRLSQTGRDELLRIHDLVTQFGISITNAFKQSETLSPADTLQHMKADAENIKTLIRETRANHLERLENNAADPMKIVVCMDILNAYTRVKEEYVNIAETLLGGK